MRKLDLILVLLVCSTLALQGQDVERPAPDDWKGIVFGGRLMDRFLPMPETGEKTANTWGAKNVKPRYIDNGLEDNEWSYWGGNIQIDDNGTYHLFVCRWREDDPKGHMAWPRSEVVHAISENSIGPYKVSQVIGPGHNPEIQKLKSGGYFLYAFKFSNAYSYYSETLDGPWEKLEFTYDTRQRELEDHFSNNTFAKREDGSMLMVGRGGGIWLSETGLPPYKKITEGTVYPPYDGRYEDPVVWRTDIQYHLVVNDWLGRLAYYMRSKNGVDWKLDKGEAYLPGIAKHKDGTIEDWYKFERIKVLQDKYGRAFQANFAVLDIIKKQDKGSDNHSSKNISIPMTVGKRIALVNTEKIDKNTSEIKVLIKAEPGFNPHKDIDLKSLHFGASEEVDFGRGSKFLRKEKVGKDLFLYFEGKNNGLTDDNFVTKLLGSTKKKSLLFGFARLPWVTYVTPILSSKFPEFSLNGKSLKAEIEVENFGQVKSDVSELTIEYLENGSWRIFKKEKIPALKPYKKTILTLWGKKMIERNKAIEVRVTIKGKNQKTTVLQGLVVVR
ncbi:glycoside hydrolase family protein [Polaribacter sp. Q13]|uniref:glycoside hydrolase family protein n=1 Tax=Polaribacter sp. Q13 TaxID=2806551 RepID=UPI00193AE224|nr:glycoside hydrolase family protein [Polaribacter sp. Q13]QVY66591.1 glycoside hydrolase family protein [Polaribacter sp. Q13]